MMSALALENFEIPAGFAGGSGSFGPASPMTEADRMAAYEQGYQAGWDDAVQSQADDQSRIGADFARNLQELSFTFHEARAHVIQGMEPLLAELVETLLPALVSETFAQTVLDHLQPLIDDSADAPVELVVAPANRMALEQKMADYATVAIRLTEEPSLAEGQAYLRIGKTERQIDMSGALDRIRAAVRSLYALNERTLKHA